MLTYVDFAQVASKDISTPQAIETFGRIALPRLVAHGALGLELGVATGYFSNALLSVGDFARLYSIDAWADHHDTAEYLRCVNLLAKHANRSVVMRMFFADALLHFPDSFFDFIYVDAYAHTGQQDGRLLTDWYPKLKPGGLFAGHDYDSAAWPQTVIAVDRFAAAIGRQLAFIPGASTGFAEDIYASWYFYK